MLIPALLKAGFNVTAITRPQSMNGATRPGVIVKRAHCDDVEKLAEALENQDAVIEAFNPAAAVNQGSIVRAAIAAGVSHLITPDFSSDTFNEHVDEVLIFEPKRKAQRELEDLVAKSGEALSWTAVIVGAWYDWAIKNGVFWINREAQTIMRFGSGNQKYAISRVELTGDAVVAVLKDPTKYRNRPAYFASHTVTTNQLIDMVKSVHNSEWKIVDSPLDGFLDEGRRLWAQDTVKGVEDRLSTKAYKVLGTAALFDEGNRYNGDFGEKLEPGWDEGMDMLKANLKGLLA